MHYYINQTIAAKDMEEHIAGYMKNRGDKDPRISKTHQHTIFKIINLYSRQSQNPLFHLDNDRGIPGFRTYTTSLAKLLGCTTRAIRDHKKRLKELNIIVAEKRLGSNGVELWFNPDILFKNQPWFNATDQTKAPESPPDNSSTTGNTVPGQPQKISHFMPSPPLQAETFSPFSTGTTRTIKTNTTSVHKCKSQCKQQEYGVATQQCVERKASTKKQERPQEHGKNGQSAPSCQGFSSPASEKSPPDKNNSGPGGRPIFLSMTRKFWALAKKKLWPGETFFEVEEKGKDGILNKIWSSVFGGFKEGFTEDEWHKYNIECLKRLDKAADWTEAHPEFQMPEAHWYFSPKNNGRVSFKNTLPWLENDRRKEIIHKVKYETTMHGKGKGRFKDKSRIELYRIHELRVARHGDKMLTERFYRIAQKIYPEMANPN